MNVTIVRTRRSSPRLSSYDYAQENYYFITACVRDRKCLFGHVTRGEMVSNSFGAIVTNCWYDLPHHYHEIHLDGFVLMPNHVHGIVSIHGDAPDGSRAALSEIVRAFKSYSARRINEVRETPGQPVWQRSFYDHIIRNDADLERIRDYVEHNPARWAEDRFYE